MNYCQFRNETIKRMANAGGGGAPADPEAVLVLPLNGNANDYSVNNYPVTIHGSPNYASGYFPDTQAIHISNGNYIEYVTIPDNYSTFSADFFAKPESARDVRTGAYSFLASANSIYGGLTVNAASSTSTGDRILATTISYGQWVHIAITRDSDNVIRLFKNGILAGSYSGQYGNWNAGSRVAIDSGATYQESRDMYISNYKLSTAVLHTIDNGIYTYPVPTGLYY